MPLYGVKYCRLCAREITETQEWVFVPDHAEQSNVPVHKECLEKRRAHKNDVLFEKLYKLYIGCRPLKMEDCEGCPFDSDDCLYTMGVYLRTLDGWKKMDNPSPVARAE